MEVQSIPQRIYLHNPAVDEPRKKMTAQEKQESYLREKAGTKVVEPHAGNLVSSKIVDSELHAPVIDFDLPIDVFPSSELGHNHLYIHKAIPWDIYVELLRVLVKAELVEPGFCQASINKGYTSVRPVGVVKPEAPRGVAVLIENAELRQELTQLRIQNVNMGRLHDELVEQNAALANALKEALENSNTYQPALDQEEPEEAPAAPVNNFEAWPTPNAPVDALF